MAFDLSLRVLHLSYFWCLRIFIPAVLRFNDTSIIVGHFVSSPRKREKRDRKDSRGDEREGQGRKRIRNESEECKQKKKKKKKQKHFPNTLTC